VLGAGPGARPPGWNDLAALPYTRAVLDEALRLYPPAWVITRRAAADDALAGVDVPAGTLIILSPWLLHRRAASWPDPSAFDPARFLDAGGRAPGSRPSGDYLPFGAGPRLCSGGRRPGARRAAARTARGRRPRGATAGRGAGHPAPPRRPAAAARTPLRAACAGQAPGRWLWSAVQANRSATGQVFTIEAAGTPAVIARSQPISCQSS